MLAAITSGVSTAITIGGDVISAIFGTASESGGVAGAWAAILPAVGLAVGFFVLRGGIGIVKSLIKGY